MNKLNAVPQDRSLEQADLIINGSLFPDEVIYENLLPYAVENGSALALSHTCKAMHQIMTTFLQNNAVKIYKVAMTQVSNLYLSIRTWTPCPLNTSPDNYPLNTPTEHYKLNASIVKAAKDSGLTCTTHRVLYPKEIEVLSQRIEENPALETIWPHIIAEIRKTHPNLALDPKMTASGIRTWMSSNTALLETIQNLDLEESELLLLPREICLLKNLEMLDLDNNQLKMLPPEIGNLTNLTKLSLDFNKLSTLPPEIGLLTNLKTLWLHDNQLTALPPQIGNLANLGILNLTHNQLTTLPPEIRHLTNLRNLSLSENCLTMLPPEIGQLTNLTALSLNINQLSALPSEITNLINLKQLNVSDNPLTTLPPGLAQLTGLTVDTS